MPTSPPRTCTKPGCPGRVQHGICTACGPRRRARDERGGSTARGYDYRWQQFRLYYLAQHPLCMDCEADGRVGPASDVHHKAKLRDNPDSKYHEANLMALCSSHHDQRTARGE